MESNPQQGYPDLARHAKVPALDFTPEMHPRSHIVSAIPALRLGDFGFHQVMSRNSGTEDARIISEE
jgi:hypothetical protein